MKRWAWLTVSLALCACQGQAPSPQEDVAAIRGLCARWTQLYNAGAFEELVATLYAEDAVLMSPGQPPHLGREAILDVYRRARALDEEHCDASLVEDILFSGGLAAVRGTDTGTTTPRSGGKPAPYSVKWLLVLKRQPDGAWRWVCEIWNDNPIAEAPKGSEPTSVPRNP